MNTYYLSKLRKEADTYYHLRINVNGVYEVFFHNYKVVSIDKANTREEGLKKLNYHKRKHILKRISELKKK